jgi:hypothetical protein
MKIETNADVEYDQFYSLTKKELKKAITAGIRKGMNYIRTAGRASLRSVMGKAASHHNPKYNDTLQQGVRNTKVVEKDGSPYGYVTITSNRRGGSGSYRLIFFEGGTVQRQTKKGYNRGSLKPLYFFGSAVEQSEHQVQSIIDNGITEAVEKINSSKR